MSNFAKKAAAQKNPSKAASVVAQMVNRSTDSYSSPDDNSQKEPEKTYEINISTNNKTDDIVTETTESADKPQEANENKESKKPAEPKKTKKTPASTKTAVEKPTVSSQDEFEITIKYYQIALENKSKTRSIRIYPGLDKELETLAKERSLETGKKENVNDLINQILFDYLKNEALKKCK